MTEGTQTGRLTSQQRHSTVDRWFWPIVVSLLSLQLLLAVDCACRWAPTHDEFWHLPLGLYGWQTGDFAVDPINPPLVRLWAALPLTWGGAPLNLTPEQRPELTAYGVGDAFLMSAGVEYWSWFFRGRLMMIPGLLLGGLIVAVWSRRWWGTPAGILAAVLWTCQPVLISNAALVAHDYPAALASLVTIAMTLWCCERPSWKRCFLLGICLGIAQLCKLSSIILWPLCPLIFVSARSEGALQWLRSRQTWPQRLEPVARIGCVVMMAWLVIQMGYGDLELWKREASFPGVLFPSAYLQGFASLKEVMNADHPIFLDQEWRAAGGFRDYYLRALSYKLPEATLLAIPLAGASFWQLRNDRVERRRCLLLFGTICAWVVPASLSGNQLGIRYILPAMPFLILWGSSIARTANFTASRFWRSVVLGIALLLPFSLRHHPHQLAYFNEISGGPRNGWKHLIDSNIDWGQDLRLLADTVAIDPSTPLGLAYFGTVSPSRAGLHYRFPPSFEPQPGRYAISVNFLAGRPHHLRDVDGRSMVAGMDEFGYFRFFEPEARLGHSIVIFDLSKADVARFQEARRLATGQ